MVAKITIPKSLEAALNYNEKKVQKGTAECLLAANYLKEASQMNFYQKLAGFETNNRLNNAATTKTIHVSLNFDPSENLKDAALVNIANDYMQRIGFGDQPFLVYKHEDAGHPHIHIVSTTIRNDGSRINTHNIGRNQSENARKAIEELFGLVKAEHKQRITGPAVQPLKADKVQYGKAETKQSISNIVNHVFHQYKFASLPEWNAALRQFNIAADRGAIDGRIFKHRGLVYRILDVQGNKIGVPIKASSINCKPTLDNLEAQFVKHASAKEVLKIQTLKTMDLCLQSSPGDIKQLIQLLEQHKIATVLRQNAEGRLYGITFVDHQNKVVFNGSDLGKQYSAAAIQSRLAKPGGNEMNQLGKQTVEKDPKPHINKHLAKTPTKDIHSPALLTTLLSPTEQFDPVAGGLLKKKRKKKSKKQL